MKKLLFVSVVVLLLPVFVFAHGSTGLTTGGGSMMNFGELQTGPEMMEYLEESALGDDLHEEMEGLMTRMMSGALTQGEAERITELMGQYPGPYGVEWFDWAHYRWNDGLGRTLVLAIHTKLACLDSCRYFAGDLAD